MNNVRVILWAQWRAVRAMLPRSGPWAFLLSGVWYLAWTTAAIAVGKIIANAGEIGLIRTALPGGLQLMVLYWQLVPVLLSATGASLDLQKLKAYPIALRDLFGIEVVLRATAAVEVLLLLVGASVGSFYNSKLPWYSPVAFLPFILFNLFLAVGLRDLVNALLRHRRFREISVLLLVCVSALPTLLASRPETGRAFRLLFSKTSSGVLPWTATANLFEGRDVAFSFAALLLWIAAAMCFSVFQYRRTFQSDQELAPSLAFRTSGERGLVERTFRWPSAVFADPLAVLMEKEIRFLARSPRFRLVFLMGFTFGLVIWLPIAAGQSGAGQNGISKSFLGSNYLTVVSVYALLLLSEVCFWNSFGFDRSAAQIYFLAPVRFSRVLVAKNLSAAFFVSIEIGAITVVCALAGMPITPMRMLEAYSVAVVVGLFLMGAGNLLSVQNARGVNPDTSFRSGAPSRIQAMLLVVYPITFVPVALAYLARYGFDSQLAFYGVLLFDALLGAVIYKLTLDSAVSSSETKREEMIAALCEGEGPIAA